MPRQHTINCQCERKQEPNRATLLFKDLSQHTYSPPIPPNPPTPPCSLEQANNILTWVFVAEAGVKILGHGRAYFAVPFNVFDFLVTIAAVVGVFINAANSLAGGHRGRKCVCARACVCVCVGRDCFLVPSSVCPASLVACPQQPPPLQLLAAGLRAVRALRLLRLLTVLPALQRFLVVVGRTIILSFSFFVIVFFTREG